MNFFQTHFHMMTNIENIFQCENINRGFPIKNSVKFLFIFFPKLYIRNEWGFTTARSVWCLIRFFESWASTVGVSNSSE